MTHGQRRITTNPDPLCCKRLSTNWAKPTLTDANTTWQLYTHSKKEYGQRAFIANPKPYPVPITAWAQCWPIPFFPPLTISFLLLLIQPTYPGVTIELPMNVQSNRPPTEWSSICIWQQNLNKSNTIQQHFLSNLNPNKYDIAAIQELTINCINLMVVNSRWSIIYPTWLPMEPRTQPTQDL